MNLKYIRFKNLFSLNNDFIIVFCGNLNHSSIASYFSNSKENVVSAGMVSLDTLPSGKPFLRCYNRSISLNINSLGNIDSDLLNSQIDLNYSLFERIEGFNNTWIAYPNEISFENFKSLFKFLEITSNGKISFGVSEMENPVFQCFSITDPTYSLNDSSYLNYSVYDSFDTDDY